MRPLCKAVSFGSEYGAEIWEFVRFLCRRPPERDSAVYVVVTESKVLAYDDCFTVQNVYGENVALFLPPPEARMKQDAVIGVWQGGNTQVQISALDERVKLEWGPGQSQPLGRTRMQYSIIYLYRKTPYLWRIRGDFVSP